MSGPFFLKETCLVIAHRGASGYEPENTLSAFERAYRMGADGIELDVQLTRDNHLVVVHDADTFRVTGVKKKIARATLRELKKLDFGRGETIPLLSEVFEHFLGKFAVINIEIKSTGWKDTGLEAALGRLIDRFGCQDQVLVSSFNPLNLHRFKRCLPSVPLGYLISPYQTILVRNRLWVRWLEPATLNMDHRTRNRRDFKVFFTFGLPKWVWTVNTDEEMRYWLDRRVNAIITDYPDRLLRLIHHDGRQKEKE